MNDSRSHLPLSSSSGVVGGREAVRRYMMDKFRYAIPQDHVCLTPDIIMYTWASVHGRPLPAGRAGEKHNYVAKITKQARTMRDYVHVLFYSRWRMTNEKEMVGQVRGENLIPVCLEDLPDLYPPEAYDWIVEKYNAVYYMDYLRQLAMYEAPRFREVVRARCGAERASVLTGNALMYVDMDIKFHSAPREWLSPRGMLSFIDVQNMDLVQQCGRDLDSVDREVIDEATEYMQGENCMVMVGYEYSRRFRHCVPVPKLKYHLLTGKHDTVANRNMCFYQQASCISHARHWTHGWWASTRLTEREEEIL